MALVNAAELDRAQASPRMTQQDLANMIGVTRQRVNLLLRRFRKSGFIEYRHGNFIVHDSIAAITGARE